MAGEKETYTRTEVEQQKSLVSRMSTLFTAAAFTIVLGGAWIYNDSKYEAFRKDEQTGTGYAQPNKLEIKIRDIDEDGKNEIYATYDDRNYLLKTRKTDFGKNTAYRQNAGEKPRDTLYLQEFKIIPAKTTPATTEKRTPPKIKLIGENKK